MSRILTPLQVERAFGVGRLVVEKWLELGCPCIRLRDRLVLFDEDDLVPWCARRGFHRLPPSPDDLAERIREIRTLDDVLDCVDIVDLILSRGGFSRSRAYALHECLQTARENLLGRDT